MSLFMKCSVCTEIALFGCSSCKYKRCGAHTHDSHRCGGSIQDLAFPILEEEVTALTAATSRLQKDLAEWVCDQLQQRETELQPLLQEVARITNTYAVAIAKRTAEVQSFVTQMQTAARVQLVPLTTHSAFGLRLSQLYKTGNFTDTQIGQLVGNLKPVPAPSSSLRISQTQPVDPLTQWKEELGEYSQTIKLELGPIKAMRVQGNVLAVAAKDCTVKVLDLPSGQDRLVLDGHSKGVTCVAFASSQTRLISGSLDCSAIVWDLTTSFQVCQLIGHQKPVKAVAFGSMETLVFTCSQDFTVLLWDTNCRGILGKFNGHLKAVNAMLYMGDWLATGSSDNSVIIWHVHQQKPELKLQGHSGGIYALDFSADLSLLASASGDRTVKLWNLARGVAVRTLKGHTRPVNTLAFSNHLLASGGKDTKIFLWAAATGELIRSLSVHGDCVTSLCFSEDRVISASKDSVIRVTGLIKPSGNFLSQSAN